jgi:hypothetical protein
MHVLFVVSLMDDAQREPIALCRIHSSAEAHDLYTAVSRLPYSDHHTGADVLVQS